MLEITLKVLVIWILISFFVGVGVGKFIKTGKGYGKDSENQD